ncbi:hypothetical protein M3J09_005236 [Ascochyta lentis]
MIGKRRTITQLITRYRRIACTAASQSKSCPFPVRFRSRTTSHCSFLMQLVSLTRYYY